jgi:hypothetical protein
LFPGEAGSNIPPSIAAIKAVRNLNLNGVWITEMRTRLINLEKRIYMERTECLGWEICGNYADT